MKKEGKGEKRSPELRRENSKGEIKGSASLPSPLALPSEKLKVGACSSENCRKKRAKDQPTMAKGEDWGDLPG